MTPRYSLHFLNAEDSKVRLPLMESRRERTARLRAARDE
jgi:hypothetical protein